MKSLAKFSLGICSAGLPALALAAPSPYVSKFGPLSIQNTTTSTLIRDTDSPSKVWVLPPSSGVVEFSGFTPSANLGFCPGLKSTIKATNGLSRQIDELGARTAALQPEIDKAEAELVEARRVEAESATLGVVRDLMEIEVQLGKNDKRIDELAKSLERCTEATCATLSAELQSVAEDSERLRNSRLEIRLNNLEEVAAYERAKLATAAAVENLDKISARVNRYSSQISALNTTLMTLYRDQGMLEAGTAFVDYKLGWADNRSALAQNYPQYEFSEIPTRNARLSASLASPRESTSYISSLPAVLDYSVNGVRFQPWGDNTTQSDGLPDVISGSFRLSLVGGCPLADKSFFDDLGVNVSRSVRGEPLYSIALNYEYPAAFSRTIEATYNLNKFYELIQKQSTKGGFFSSKSYSEVVENIPNDEATFSIKFIDEEGTMSEEEKSRIRTDVKAELLGRVLQMLGTPNNGADRPSSPLPNGTPPTRGAVVLANGLSQTCGWSIYCTAGSWLLRSADSIWGSSSSESVFRSTWNRTATEEWSQTSVRWVPGATGFPRN